MSSDMKNAIQYEKEYLQIMFHALFYCTVFTISTEGSGIVQNYDLTYIRTHCSHALIIVIAIVWILSGHFLH